MSGPMIIVSVELGVIIETDITYSSKLVLESAVSLGTARL